MVLSKERLQNTSHSFKKNGSGWPLSLERKCKSYGGQTPYLSGLAVDSNSKFLDTHRTSLTTDAWFTSHSFRP